MIAGIVCEYNPFHRGHLYHLEQTRLSGAQWIICVMSGNFVQRGECAYLDKWTRAKIAVACGADIVIDLPTPWSCAPAQTFARGSIALLKSFGIDALSFGCESDIEALTAIQQRADASEEVSRLIKKYTAGGESYPKAMYRAVKEIFGEAAAEPLAAPNSTLALEYIRQLQNYDAPTALIPIKRLGCGHDGRDIAGGITSASHIRSMSLEESAPFLPENSYQALRDLHEKGFAPCRLENCERAILSKLREIPKSDFENYIDSGGLASRIYRSAMTADSLESLCMGAKAKNYTLAGVRRDVLRLYLGITADMSAGTPPYLKILAASRRGLTLLASVKEHSPLPVITKHAEAQKLTGRARALYDLECACSDQFALCTEKILPAGLEQKNSISIL